MITTLLGTCDVCDQPDREIARCFVTGIETFACDECRGDDPHMRPLEDHPQASDLLSFVALAMFVGTILMVAP